MSDHSAEVAAVLNRLDEVRWDRCIVNRDVTVYGWIDRDDGRADFVVLEFWVGEENQLVSRVVATSSAELSQSIVRRIHGDGIDHTPCRRVEDVFAGLVTNAVRQEAGTRG